MVWGAIIWLPFQLGAQHLVYFRKVLVEHPQTKFEILGSLKNILRQVETVKDNNSYHTKKLQYSNISASASLSKLTGLLKAISCERTGRGTSQCCKEKNTLAMCILNS